MSYATQPIAVAPRQTDNELYTTGFASFSPRNVMGPTGSPMSFRSGSFQNRFYPGGSPGQSLGPIAMPDFKRGSWDNTDWFKAAVRSSTSAIDVHGNGNGSGSGQGHNNSFVLDDDLCRNYTCCGLALPDLHALVDHFENNHVEILPDDDSQTPSLYSSSHSSPDAFDADDMDISPSPAATPSPTTPFTSAFDPIRVESSTSMSMSMSSFFRPSTYSSLAGGNGTYNYPTNVHYNNNFASPTSTTGTASAAFNRYAGYSDYSSNLPGTDPSPTYHYQLDDKEREQEGQGRCVQPALLYSNSAEPSPLNTPASSRTGSPVGASATGAASHTQPSGTLSLHPDTPQSQQHGQAQRQQSHTSSSQQTFHARPGSNNVSTTLTKPFKCPKQGCNKSYKQQNGLKYHLSHGQCNFAPRDPEVEKLSEVERERRLRPFVCMVIPLGAKNGEGCGRRYKNMNGLRYHYTHTGEHGAIGLEMLAQNKHPLPDVACLPSSHSSSPRISTSNANASGSTSTAASISRPAPNSNPAPISVSAHLSAALSSYAQAQTQSIRPLNAHASFAIQPQHQQTSPTVTPAMSSSNTPLTTPLTSSANSPLASRQGSPTGAGYGAAVMAGTFGTVPMPAPSLIAAQGQAWGAADVIMG
ncbi:hypothetical protein BU17DRAFT_70195 [Hysterangium stoloniferum]|nr:hypothetical protein BU17DRAFT_70195 [Hysterangium stoloniferum]